jgi:peroxiredoxin family protein
MEKGLAASNLALAALASGARVTIFFTFWGLNLVKKPGARVNGGLLARLMAAVGRDHSGRQRLGRMNMLGMGRIAMAKLMRSKGLPSSRDGLVLAHQMGARIVACTTTLELMGLSRESLIPEVDDVAGAATFLQAARGATVVTLS